MAGANPLYLCWTTASSGRSRCCAGAVNETCTATIIQLQPAVDGLAVMLKKSSGLESNFALTAAS
jgi:hypothetical protein